MAPDQNESPKERDLWDALPTLQGIERGQTYFDLSLMAFEQGEHTKSLALAETACSCFLEHSDEVGYANCLTSVAFNLHALGRKEEAISAMFKAVMRFAKTSDSQEWEYRGYLAQWLRDAGEIEMALIQYRKCFDRYDSENFEMAIANVTDNIGQLLCDLDRCDEAIVAFQKSREMVKREGEPGLVACADIAIARCFNHLKDGHSAKDYAYRAIGVFDSTSNNFKRAQAYAQLGRAFNVLEQYEEGLEALETAHKLVTGWKSIDFHAIYAIQKSKVRALRGLGRESEAAIIERRNSVINETLGLEQK